jgi:heavy-metal-associated domain-containing protein
MLTTFRPPVFQTPVWAASQGGTATRSQPPRRAPAYFHAIEGRVRIKIAAVKDAPATAVTLEEQLQCACAGIDHVTANPTTGNVLIEYNPGQTGLQEILETLQAQGWVPLQELPSIATAEPVVTSQERNQALARILLRAAMKCALQQLVRAWL